MLQRYYEIDARGRSREGAWIEIALACAASALSAVAPARERGLKYYKDGRNVVVDVVAPARERGLKFKLVQALMRIYSRSREGAWIEIRPRMFPRYPTMSLPRGSVD